jgi:hypothetical protein
MSDELKPQATIDTPEFADMMLAWALSKAGDDAAERYDKIIAHINAWGARLAGVPAGMKLVPILSTDVMDIAGREMLRACGHERPTKRDAELCWSAMIDAAPKPEAP